jgi:hypothetical protein
MLRQPSRQIAGEWDSVAFRTSVESHTPSDLDLESNAVASFSQRGNRVKGIRIQTEVREGHTACKLVMRGKIKGDYLVYESVAADPERFIISTGSLYIHPGGREMFGYFVGNGGRNDPKRTWVVSSLIKSYRVEVSQSRTGQVAGEHHLAPGRFR